MTLRDRTYAEKRNFIRMKIDTMVSFTIRGSAERHEGRCKNLSGNGMLLETGKKLQTGDSMSITVPSENSHFSNLNATAEVLRVVPVPNQHKYEVGVVIKQIKH